MQICILYGSQTGNSQCIAEELSQRLNEELKISTKCNSLNSVKEEINQLKNKYNLVFVVCSTTGNGDAPDNASQFWKIIKNRALPKTLFENMKYSVLGLGDTNYDKFCAVGKNIDKRLHELGSIRCIDLCCADEASNLEETVDEWIIKVLDFCKTNLHIYL
jgi:sulfite reductase alpha subunit-like flavoprotein